MIKNIIRKIRLFSNKKKEPYLLFYNLLGFYPDNIDYYQLALHHKSLPIKTSDGQELTNERLEFLGDSILSSIVTDIVYHRFTTEQEGFLTQMRARIVNRESLNQLALELGLDKIVVATKYVNKNATNDIYGNALEALMGAIYLDRGYPKTKKFVEEHLFSHFINWDEMLEREINYKSRIFEWCHKHRLEPEFVLLNEVVDRNKHTFHTRLLIRDKVICEATGSSKKESQQNASRIAYEKFSEDPHLVEELLTDNEEPSPTI